MLGGEWNSAQTETQSGPGNLSQNCREREVGRRGGHRGPGFCLCPTQHLSLLPRVAEVLEGKGAGKKGRFQGKATKMSRRAEVQALLQDYVSTQSAEE